MATADQQRFLTIARDYDRMAPVLVPMYGWLQEEMLQLLQVEEMGAGCLVDLGAGSGIFLEKVLARNPEIQCVWIDSSSAFLEVAQGRLARFADRVTYIQSPLEEAWEAKVNMPVLAITSMSAIHHLLREGIEEFFPATDKPSGQLCVVVDDIFQAWESGLAGMIEEVRSGGCWPSGGPTMGAIYHLVEHISYHLGQVVWETERLAGHHFAFCQRGMNERSLNHSVEEMLEESVK